MNKLFRTYLPLMALSICLHSQADCDFDDFPRMDDMLVSGIGDNVQWNHAPINARAFRVPSSVTGVKDFYAGEWADAVDFTEFDGWNQILHINEDCMMMVQVKAQNDRFSYGRMSITNPPENSGAVRELGGGMPVPPDAEVISDMRSDDKIRKGRMVLVLSHDTMHATRAWYEAELLNQGWQLEHRSQQANATVLSFAKGRELMTVGLLRHAEKTQVLLNRMDR